MEFNFRTWHFKQLLDLLPDDIQNLAQTTFELFREDATHPSLRLHQLGDTKRGRHQAGSISVSISRRYRAIYVVRKDGDDTVNLWYWIGSHSDYNSFTGRK